MAKVTLDWKAPSERKMADFVGELSNEMKKDFAKACVETNKEGKTVINKSNAKKWLVKHFDNTDDIEWLKRPVKKESRKSGAVTIAEWLDL